MNNRATDHSLPDGAARNIVNANVDAAGRIRRRDGLTKIYSGVAICNGYSCPAGEFFVEAGNLMQLNSDNTSTRLQHGIVGALAYHYMLGIVYISDNRNTYKIVNGGVIPWGLPRPPEPTLSSTSGSLPAGVYAAAIVGVDSDGLESGSSKITTIKTFYITW